MLIPELFVERGKTYTFKIQTGDNLQKLAEYHPFYITSGAKGGYKQRTAQERNVSTKDHCFFIFWIAPSGDQKNWGLKMERFSLTHGWENS